MHAMQYWTDREYGARPRLFDVIGERAWGGIRSLIMTGVEDGSFGHRFPEQCADGGAACGCDWQAFGDVLRAEVPNIDWPLRNVELPATDVILDVLEFCARAVGDPIKESYHGYFGHDHLSWNREVGLARFVGDVNRIFSRNGVAYELTVEGNPRRLLPEPLLETLGTTVFRTGDDETDRLLEAARRGIALPKEEDRRNALEKLWDAFERLKTLEPGSNKSRQADALLDRAAAPSTTFRELLGTEAASLTKIGNTFRIRHSEVTQEILSSGAQVDYLVGRMFAFVQLLLKATNRGG